MNEKIEVKEKTVKRIGGYLHWVIPIADKSGDIISYTLKPLMVEFKPRDIIQVTVGAALLALPISFTEEAWELGETLPDRNVLGIGIVSFLLIALFVYFNFYRSTLKGHVSSYIKRSIGTYLISLLVVAVILTMIEKCPWGEDNLLAIKRVIIVAFPASMSGTLSDTIK